MAICQTYDELMRDYLVNQRRPCTDVDLCIAVEDGPLPTVWGNQWDFSIFASPRCQDPIEFSAHAVAHMILSVTKGCEP
jgi:hypothetical protein